MHPRILIVGTVPYNTRATSRAFDAYFHEWEKENLAQIFSHTKKPCKGHCASLYQITDKRMLQRWLGKRVETGKIYQYDELPDTWENNDLEIDTLSEKAYKIGRKHNSITHLLRGILWRKRFWCTKQLKQWLDEFQPECVFLSFSNDYFISEIAMYVAKRYDIPIVSSIGDDYYFNVKRTMNPLYHLYKQTYRALIRRVLSWRGSAIYISNKIRDKYNMEFGLDGETVYLTSDIQRKPFTYINKHAPVITYFGNIRMGRNHSLCDIAEALAAVNPAYRLEVFSNEQDEEYISVFKKHPNIIYGGSIPYQQVQQKMQQSDVTVIVEGFAEHDIDKSRYSLSTKAADALASGAAILTYGSQECGIIEYMQSTNASTVCIKKEELVEAIRQMINDEQQQQEHYRCAIEMSEKHHQLKRSCETFERVVQRAMNK